MPKPARPITMPVFLHRLTLIALLLGLLSSCSSVLFVAPYDAEFDRGLASLQEDTAVFLARMRRTRGSHDANATFYDEATARVDALRMRAELYGEKLNQGTLTNLDRLQGAFKDLQEAHRDGPLSSSVWARTMNTHFRTLLQIELHKKHSLTINPPEENPS